MSIEKIEEVRKANNSFWMNILRIAYIHAPDETVEQMKNIVAGDTQVINFFREMIDDYEDIKSGNLLDPDAVYNR